MKYVIRYTGDVREDKETLLSSDSRTEMPRWSASEGDAKRFDTVAEARKVIAMWPTGIVGLRQVPA